jgi:hypothetical protein
MKFKFVILVILLMIGITCQISAFADTNLTIDSSGIEKLDSGTDNPVISVERVSPTQINVVTMSEDERSAFVKQMRNKGYSDEQIAKEIVASIKLNYNASSTANQIKSETTRMVYSPSTMMSSVKGLDVDSTILNATQWWPYLIADKETQERILTGIDQMTITIDKKE